MVWDGSAPKLGAAAFLDGFGDIVFFVKNSQSTPFRMEHQDADESIANAYPDFPVNRSEAEIWIIETKGEKDLDDPPKWDRFKLCCPHPRRMLGSGRSSRCSPGRKNMSNISRKTLAGRLPLSRRLEWRR